MSQDPLTDIVKSLDLKGAVFLRADFTAPWAITAHVTEDDCRPFMPIPRQVIAYHVVVEGTFHLHVDDAEGNRHHHRAKAGDVLFFPHNREHVLTSGRGVSPVSGDDLILPSTESGLAQIKHGGGGDRTRILCGFMASDAGSNPLLDTLPEVLIIPIESLDTRTWIAASVVMAARQLSSGTIQSTSMVSSLCQLLLTEALRTHVANDAKPPGWLRGMAHPRMARALSEIHGSLHNPPSVESLASQVGMSRSAFVDRFTEVMGNGPRRYILKQRMDLAATLLRDTQLSSAEIALRAGYDAPEAFSRAFKRENGLAPAEWRRRQ